MFSVYSVDSIFFTFNTCCFSWASASRKSTLRRLISVWTTNPRCSKLSTISLYIFKLSSVRKVFFYSTSLSTAIMFFFWRADRSFKSLSNFWLKSYSLGRLIMYFISGGVITIMTILLLDISTLFLFVVSWLLILNSWLLILLMVRNFFLFRWGNFLDRLKFDLLFIFSLCSLCSFFDFFRWWHFSYKNY